MKKKVFLGLLVFITVLSIIFTNTLAATGICNVETSVSKSTIKPGEEVKMIVSIKDITEPVAGIGFSLEYDNSKFELVSAVASTGWMSSNVENLYTILTSTFEGTKTAGNVMTITLKAKSTITGTTAERIALISTQVSKEDSSIVELGTISQNVTISDGKQNTNVINNAITNTTTNTVTNTTNTTTNTITNTTNVVKNTTNTNPITTTNVVKNTSTTNTSKMPNTGANDTLLFAIIGVAIVGGISYLLYKRNNI